MNAEKIDYQGIALIAKAKAETCQVTRAPSYEEEKHQKIYNFFYTVFQQLRRSNFEVSWSSINAHLADFDPEEKMLLSKMAVSCFVEQELKRLEIIPKNHSTYSALFYVIQKLKTLWTIAIKHAETSDSEAQKKGFAAMQLVMNLCRETKRSILSRQACYKRFPHLQYTTLPNRAENGLIIDLQYAIDFKLSWEKYLKNAAPELKKSRNIAAIIADIVTFLPLILLQLGYRYYAGTWGIFSASRTFRVAFKTVEPLSELPERVFNTSHWRRG
jgi:hypothetical protein